MKDKLTEPKERPILFSGPMVRAILEGRKTQHRATVGGCTIKQTGVIHGLAGPDTDDIRCDAESREWYCEAGFWRKRCPFGGPGTRLWVKENCWIAPKRFGDTDLNNCKDYDGDGRVVGYSATMDGESVRCAKDYGVKQSPSIHMPRWASRITLEIVAVRVERLQEISEEDALAEGCVAQSERPYDYWEGYNTKLLDRHGNQSHQMLPKEYHPNPPAHWVEVRTHKGSQGLNIPARSDFSSLWESIHGLGSWDANPWVWVLDFRRIEL